MKRRLLSCLLSGSLLAAAASPAAAHPNASDASALSMLPVAVSVAAPVMILSAGAMLTVVAVEATSAGTVWILERASDGARASVTLSAQAAGGLSVAAGTAVVVTAFSAGWVLSAAGKAIAYIPNEVGAALLHNERLTR
jgi:copper(I)-binding protein